MLPRYIPSHSIERCLRAAQPASTLLRARYTDSNAVDACLAKISPHRTAEAEEAGWIIVGARGQSGFDDFLVGSVAEKIVRMSPIPVLTVKWTLQGRGAFWRRSWGYRPDARAACTVTQGIVERETFCPLWIRPEASVVGSLAPILRRNSVAISIN